MIEYAVIIISVILTAIFNPLFIRQQRKGISLKSLALKMLGASCFVAAGAAAYCIAGKNSFSTAMLWGLVFSWFGDLFLHIKGKIGEKCFVVGVLSFFAAHVMYIYAINGKQRQLFPDKPFIGPIGVIVILALLVLYVLLLFVVLKIKPSVLMLGLLPYALILALMLIKATALAIPAARAQSVVPIGSALLIFGGLMFFLSDTSLGVLIFSKKHSNIVSLKAYNMTTYFAGQLALAMSIMYF